MADHSHTIYKRPAELLQNLIRFNTTNPPGDERECIYYIKALLEDAGYETTVLAKDENRPNVIARLKGEGGAPGILLYGHVDVVPTENQDWSQPPFEATITNDYIWGRGALDMKGGVAMMLAAFLRAKAEGLKPAGDITLAIVSDEEAGGDYGAKFLTEEHPEEFDGIRYAIGEFGGFPMYIAGKKFYPIQVAEKKICWMKATISGKGGHASFPTKDGTMARTATMLLKMNANRLPVHISPVVKKMFDTMAESVPDPMKSMMLQLTNPEKTHAILDQMGPQGVMFDAMLHNTANATIIKGGGKINVLPSRIEVEMDGRILPSFTPDDMIKEMHDLVGEDIQIDLVRYDDGSREPDMGWYDTLAGILKEADPSGTPIPFLLPAVTDARFFSAIDIQTYGFLPMNLSEDFDFLSTIHAANERIPVNAVTFGTEAVSKALQRMK